MTRAARTLLTVLLASSPLLAQQAEVRLSRDPLVVPMSHATRHVTVEVEVRGRPYLFQVDTYASIDACVDDDFAREMGFERIGTALNSDGRNEQERDIVRIDELRLGGATFTGMRALVDDYGWIEREDGRELHGLLGFPAFRDVLLTFDYPGHRLVLRRGALEADDAHVLPFELTSGSPDVRVTMGGRRLLFGIDTGSGAGFSIRLEDAERLPMHSEPVLVGRARSAYTTYDVFSGALSEAIDFAGHAMEPVFVELSEGPARRLIGYRVLRSFAVTFDQRERRVRFERAPAPAPVELSEEQAQSWAGVYRGPGDRSFTIEREGTALFLRQGDWPRVAATPVANDELLIRHGPVRVRRSTEEGREGWLLLVEHPDRAPVELRPFQD